MDIGCNCFNVATAAKVPVKRYNLLVPLLFPVTEPNPARPLGVGVEKDIKRLGEYLERNEHRIPKVHSALWLRRHSRRRHATPPAELDPPLPSRRRYRAAWRAASRATCAAAGWATCASRWPRSRTW